MKKLLVSGIALAAVLSLTACGPGAQNTDPSGDNPGSSNNRTSPAQANKTACGLASDAALADITDASKAGPARAGWAFEGDGGWYIAAPLGDKGQLSGVVGLFASDDDPTDVDFDGKVYALDDTATGKTSLSAASGSFDESSSAAKKALGCESSTDD